MSGTSTPDLGSDTPNAPNFRFGIHNNSELKPFSFTVPTSTLSPEKSPHLRRSPRFSGTAAPSSSDVHLSLFDAVQFAVASRPSTPENDPIQDEPSTTLASRIMRAQDNPSPPPIPSSSFDYLDQPFPFSDFDSLLNDNAGHVSPVPLIATDNPQPSSQSTPNPSHSLASPSCVPLSSSPALASSSAQVSVDFNSVHDADVDTVTYTETDSQPSISDRLEEADVVDQLISSLEEPINPEKEGGEAPIINPVPESPGQTAVRSSRPRRSTANYAIPVEDVATSLVDSAVESSKNAAQRSESASGFPQPVSRSVVREKSPSRKKPPISKRQLGSLSPGSVTVLNQLLPPPLTPLKETSADEEITVFSASASEGVSGQPTRPIFGAPPIRFSSPRRPNSPQKIRLRPNDLDDPDRTPARRIPISTTKVTDNFFVTGSSKPSNIFKIPTTDSPARRIPIHSREFADASPSKGKMPSGPFRNPVRPLLQRSKSAEPQPALRPQLVPKKRSGSVEPVGIKGKEPGHTIRGLSADKLKSASQNPLSHAIPEETEPQEMPRSGRLLTSPLKVSSSRLKQTTSRIPRMKPYSRPQSASVQKADKPSGIARHADRGKATSSNVIQTEKTQSAAVAHPSLGPGLITKPRTILPTTSPSLKRKRGPEININSTKVSSPAKSPTKLSPMVVVPTLKTALGRPQIPSRATPEREQAKHSPVESQSEPSDTLSEQPAFVEASVIAPESPGEHHATQDSSVAGFQHHEPAPSSLPSDSTLRRTTRARKPVQPTASSQSHPARRPERPPSRRSRPIIQDMGPFSNMSAVALRTLTNSNTTKNQRYLAAILEMEIVRKDGPRPESPAMKVKTIVEKEKEENERNRNARAERRARRNQGSSEDITMNAPDSSKSDSDEDEWQHSDMSPTPRRHHRGAGEEEDYETPDRSLRPVKRMRLLDNDVGDEEDALEKKRVKWDRGLFQEMYLDDIKPRQQQARSKTPDVVKGCLAPTAKALRLDTLGNLPNAESPLKELVQENVVVKKFVYDTDVEEVPAVPVETTKSTRSKSRKSKS